MRGAPLNDARRALAAAIRALSADGGAEPATATTFNVVSFGSQFCSLFPESRPATAEAVAEAVAHIESLDANFGGSDLWKPLNSLLLTAPHAGDDGALAARRVGGKHAARRQVVLVTDGQTNEKEATMELVRAHASACRVFVVGVGATPGRHFLRMLARAGGGLAEFVPEKGADLKGRMERLLRRAATPALTNVKVEWFAEGESLADDFGGASSVVQSPATVGSLFDGEPLVLYAMAPRKYDRARVSAVAADGRQLVFEAHATAATAFAELDDGEDGGGGGGDGVTRPGGRTELLRTLAAKRAA